MCAMKSLLGDRPEKDYSDQLNRFTEFAAAELRWVIGELGLRNGDLILDAGCGTGLVTKWLVERVAPNGWVVGIDISSKHLRDAKNTAEVASIVQADISALPFRRTLFDWVWISNTANHLRAAEDGIRTLSTLLRRGGRLVIGQSAFLPDMFFAWNAPLEERITRACRQYYRDKYGLSEADTSATRNLIGLAQRAGLCDVTARTVVMERTSPLSIADERYFVETVFSGYWGEKLRTYLSQDDWAELQRLCDPASPEFCLRRPDFHHVQTFTVVTGESRS